LAEFGFRFGAKSVVRGTYHGEREEREAIEGLGWSPQRNQWAKSLVGIRGFSPEVDDFNIV
jgi:hypothetical protein